MQEPLLLDHPRRGRTTAHTGCSETGVFEIGRDTREIGLGKDCRTRASAMAAECHWAIQLRRCASLGAVILEI